MSTFVIRTLFFVNAALAIDDDAFMYEFGGIQQVVGQGFETAVVSGEADDADDVQHV